MKHKWGKNDENKDETNARGGGDREDEEEQGNKIWGKTSRKKMSFSVI